MCRNRWFYKGLECLSRQALRHRHALRYARRTLMKSYSLRDARRLAIGTSDWRQAMWNKWLVGYLTPRADELERETSSGAGAAPDESSTPSTSQYNVEKEIPLRTSETLRPPVPSPEFEHPTSTQLREMNRFPSGVALEQ